MRVLIVALSFAFLVSCSDEAASVRYDKEQVTVEAGRKFAEDIVSGKFSEARSRLTRKLQEAYPPETLADRYKKMIAYWNGQPAKVDEHFEFMDEWPARQGNDIGWVYISIAGEDYLEAVTVIVTDENGSPKIREVEWGRP